MKLLAKNIYRAYLIYREYLSNNNLDDDSNSITADAVIEFVEKEIDEEERKEIEKFVDQGIL